MIRTSLLIAFLIALPFEAVHSGEALAAKAPVDPKAVIVESESDPWFTLTADLRARWEYVSQEGREDAHAATLRSRLGILSKEFHGFQAFAEYEGTLTVDRDSYYVPGVQGDSSKAVIADPESHEWNQGWISYTNWDSNAKVGRQRINRDNQRFIGAVGWRQNEQTFDAVAIETKAIKDFSIYYGYINRANRIFGSEVDDGFATTDFIGNSHAASASYTGIPNATVSTYAYFLDLHNDVGDTNSNQSFGGFIDGTIPMSDAFTAVYRAEYAYQTEAYDSPLDYGASYFHLVAGGKVQKTSFGVGYESLGADNGVGFKTPLATLHKFNGYADKFLNTPGEGLGDLYIYAGTELPFDIKGAAAYHFFGDDGGSFDYGQEVDLVLTKKLTERATALTKFAYYFADDFATDTAKVTVEVNWKF